MSPIAGSAQLPEMFGAVVSVTAFKTRRGCPFDRQRYSVRPRCGRLEPRRKSLLPFRPCNPGGPRVDQLLSCLSSPRGVWRLQAVWCRPGDSQDDARSLSADEKHAGELQPEETRLLLIHDRSPAGYSPPDSF